MKDDEEIETEKRIRKKLQAQLERALDEGSKSDKPFGLRFTIYYLGGCVIAAFAFIYVVKLFATYVL